jgi:hypothetical protein
VHLVAAAVAVFANCSSSSPSPSPCDDSRTRTPTSLELRFFDADNAAGSSTALVASMPIAHPNASFISSTSSAPSAVRVTHMELAIATVTHAGPLAGPQVSSYNEGYLLLGWGDGAQTLLTLALWREIEPLAESEDANTCARSYASRLRTRVRVIVDAQVDAPPSEPDASHPQYAESQVQQLDQRVISSSVFSWRMQRVVATVFAHGLLRYLGFLIFMFHLFFALTVNTLCCFDFFFPV